MHPWILVFKSKYSEMEWVMNRSAKGEENRTPFGSNDNVVRLRGLPFDCSKPDITKFFDGKFNSTLYLVFAKIAFAFVQFEN